jgi:uncharacterized protein YbjT (DUF2867 family)
MAPSKKKVVICGITGSQGGSVFEALKDDEDMELIGFSRNVERARSKLDNSKVTLHEGDLNDLASLQTIFQGADYVFGMSQPWNQTLTHADRKSELQQGQNIVQACLDNKVKHLVFSSVKHDDVTTDMEHIISKIEIEKYIHASGLRYTILQPVQYADNIGLTFFPVTPGWIKGFVDGDAKVPYISCRDIGLVTRCVLQDPSKYQRQSIPLLGDLVSGDELAMLMSEIRGGETFRYCAVPRLVLRIFAKEFYLMRVFFETFGRDPHQQAKARNDIAILKAMVPELSSMKDHLERQGWATRVLVADNENQKRQKMMIGGFLVASLGVIVAVALKKRGG